MIETTSISGNSTESTSQHFTKAITVTVITYYGPIWQNQCLVNTQKTTEKEKPTTGTTTDKLFLKAMNQTTKKDTTMCGLSSKMKCHHTICQIMQIKKVISGMVTKNCIHQYMRALIKMVTTIYGLTSKIICHLTIRIAIGRVMESTIGTTIGNLSQKTTKVLTKKDILTTGIM